MSRLLHIQQQLRRICFWCTTWRCCELLQYLATLANFPGHHKRRNWKEQPWINDVFLVSLCTSQKSQCAYSPILLTWPKVFNTVFNTWHAIRVSLNKLQDHIFSAGSNTNLFFFPFFFINLFTSTVPWDGAVTQALAPSCLLSDLICRFSF